VTLNRPEVRHAIDLEVIRGLEEAVDRIEKETRLTVFVLRTTGSAFFSSGGDLAAFEKLDSTESFGCVFGRMRTLLCRLERLDRWTIAAIDGDAYGGGWELAMAFDFRIASPHSRLCFSQGAFGLIPGWGGMTRLIERVGRQRALRLLATQSRLDARSCLDLGLIDALCDGDDFDSEIRRFTESFPNRNPSFVAALKQVSNDVYPQSRRESMEREFREFERLWFSSEHNNAVRLFLESRVGSDQN
jgi:enoyl-CoA hydratase/carnithine racemase